MQVNCSLERVALLSDRNLLDVLKEPVAFAFKITLLPKHRYVYTAIYGYSVKEFLS
jgi:hypothetical protein